MYRCVQQKKHEKFVIFDTDTIAHPRTVMIHSQYTLLAHLAVMRTGRFHSLTPRAVARLG